MNRRGLAYLLIGGGIFVVLMVILTFFQASEAATFPSASDLGVPGPFQSTGTAFKTTWETIVAVAGVIFLVIILIGGVMYLISAGEEQNQTRAKNLIRDGIIGIALVALAWPIGLAVLNVLGLSSNLGLSGGSNPSLGTPGRSIQLGEPSSTGSGGSGGSNTPTPSASTEPRPVDIQITGAPEPITLTISSDDYGPVVVQTSSGFANTQRASTSLPPGEYSISFIDSQTGESKSLTQVVSSNESSAWVINLQDFSANNSSPSVLTPPSAVPPR